MQLRQFRVNRAQQIGVVVAVDIARQTALDADLGCSPGRRLTRLLTDLFRSEEISRLITRTDTERAKLTPHKADVGEIDVAGDDVADNVAYKLPADFIRGNGEPEQLIAAGICEEKALLAGQNTAVKRGHDLFERFSYVGRNPVANIFPATLLQCSQVAPTRSNHRFVPPELSGFAGLRHELLSRLTN